MLAQALQHHAWLILLLAVQVQSYVQGHVDVRSEASIPSVSELQPMCAHRLYKILCVLTLGFIGLNMLQVQRTRTSSVYSSHEVCCRGGRLACNDSLRAALLKNLQNSLSLSNCSSRSQPRQVPYLLMVSIFETSKASCLIINAWCSLETLQNAS